MLKNLQFWLENGEVLPSMIPMNPQLEQNAWKNGSFLEANPYFHLYETSCLRWKLSLEIPWSQIWSKEANTSPEGVTSHQCPFVNQGIAFSKYACKDMCHSETRQGLRESRTQAPDHCQSGVLDHWSCLSTSNQARADSLPLAVLVFMTTLFFRCPLHRVCSLKTSFASLLTLQKVYVSFILIKCYAADRKDLGTCN